MNESTNDKRDNRIVVLLAIVLVLLMVSVYSLTQLVALRSSVRSLESQCAGVQSSISNVASSSLQKSEMEELLKSYLDQYFDQEKGVAASYTLDVSQINGDEGTAEVTVVCIPRYEVTDKQEVTCYAASGSDQTLIYQADSLEWDGTVLKATMTLPVSDTYSYFITLPNETGAKVTQCLADCNADWNGNWDDACDLESVATVNVDVYMTQYSGDETMELTLEVESFGDDLSATVTTLVDGAEYETHDIQVSGGGFQELPLSYESSAFKAGQQITFRVDAASSDGRTGVAYADLGFMWGEDGNVTMLGVNQVTGEITVNGDDE